MAIGQPLNAGMVNQSLTQVAQSIGHAFLMVDQFTDALAGMTQAQVEALGFSTGDATDVRAIRDQWDALLAVYRGQTTQANYVQTNYRPNVKKVVGIHF